jgi:DnaJ homolog subfamily A member 2
LTGIDFVIKHLDGRKIRIKNNPGEVVKHDELKVVENMGMPFNKKVYNFGNLFIHFKVKFPETLDTKSLQLISSALGSDKPLTK